MEGVFVYSVVIVIAAIVTAVLIQITKNVKLSCIISPVSIEITAMAYYQITEGSISQFGPIPYLIVFPFLLIGSILGAIFWIYWIRKS